MNDMKSDIEETAMLGPCPAEPVAPSPVDPSGRPTAVEAWDPVLNLIAALGIGGVIVLGTWVATGALERHTMGNLRSTKINWQQPPAQTGQGNTPATGQKNSQPTGRQGEQNSPRNQPRP
jgi:hypothetical protein